MIGLLKEPLSIHCSVWKVTRIVFPVISLSLLGAQKKDFGTALQTLLTRVICIMRYEWLRRLLGSRPHTSCYYNIQNGPQRKQIGQFQIIKIYTWLHKAEGSKAKEMNYHWSTEEQLTVSHLQLA